MKVGPLGLELEISSGQETELEVKKNRQTKHELIL
jgi:hypothetical protein